MRRFQCCGHAAHCLESIRAHPPVRKSATPSRHAAQYVKGEYTREVLKLREEVQQLGKKLESSESFTSEEASLLDNNTLVWNEEESLKPL